MNIVMVYLASSCDGGGGGELRGERNDRNIFSSDCLVVIDQLCKHFFLKHVDSRV